MFRTLFPWILLVMASAAWAVAVSATDEARSPGAPEFTDDGRLQPPTGYHHWVFLTADLGMGDHELPTATARPSFSNVFANPAAYRAFLRTGTWPEHTQLIKEFRASTTRGTINRQGHLQQGGPASVLVHVKDSARFKGGWGFFVFTGTHPKPARVLPRKAACYSCHRAHGAVATTFVQFYPDLLPLARKDRTLARGYLSDKSRRTQAAP